MTTGGRDAFLQRVRAAVRDGNRPGSAVPLSERGTLGYQGAGTDPVGCFCERLTAAGGVAHLASGIEDAATRVLELVQARGSRRALLGRGTFLDRLGLADRLREANVEVIAADAFLASECREPFFAADIGISPVDYLIAETGSLAVLAKTHDPRSVSLVPPVHIAVADRSQLLPDLFDLFARLNSEMPSCLTLITGPSKTGDIELRLVTGVHGPGELHVVLV